MIIPVLFLFSVSSKSRDFSKFQLLLAWTDAHLPRIWDFHKRFWWSAAQHSSWKRLRCVGLSPRQSRRIFRDWDVKWSFLFRLFLPLHFPREIRWTCFVWFIFLVETHTSEILVHSQVPHYLTFSFSAMTTRGRALSHVENQVGGRTAFFWMFFNLFARARQGYWQQSEWLLQCVQHLGTSPSTLGRKTIVLVTFLSRQNH